MLLSCFICELKAFRSEWIEHSEVKIGNNPVFSPGLAVSLNCFDGTVSECIVNRVDLSHGHCFVCLHAEAWHGGGQEPNLDNSICLACQGSALASVCGLCNCIYLSGRGPRRQTHL